MSATVRVADAHVNLLPKNGTSRDVWMPLEELEENCDPLWCVGYGEVRPDFCACVTSIWPLQVPVVQLEPAHLQD